MKRTLFHYILAIAAWTVLLAGCKRDSDYLKSTPSPFIPNFDLRKLYMGQDVVLNTELMRGATMVRGYVISDHSGNNMPPGLLILQNSRMVGNGIDSLRGIAINIGADAALYVPGDSVHVNIDGGLLTKINGLLQITGMTGSDVSKVGSGITLRANRGLANMIQARPDWYDCTLITLTKATYNPTLEPTDVIAGLKILNDGTENLQLYTETDATFANTIPPYSGNYTGIVFNVESNGSIIPQQRIRNADDIVTLSATVDIPEFVITGYNNDPEGTDANYEYVQFRAVMDIDFAATPFSVVISNNAGASIPTGLPTQGWATGGLRSYKFELKSGTAKKGDFFYVGGAGGGGMINAANSTVIPASKWITRVAYHTVNHESPPFYPGGPTGTAKNTNPLVGITNLLANSGNAFGIAVFRGLEVRETSVPIDVIWTGTAGTIYQASPPRGFRIGNTDHYDIIEPLTGFSQPFYRSGTNQARYAYLLPANQGFFIMMGGIFDTTLNKWVKARRTHLDMVYVDLEKNSTLDEIENEDSTEIR